MVHQNKILRVLQLIVALQNNPPKTKQQLSDLLDSGTRTIYRYFELLEAIGFYIEKDYHKRYYIATNKLLNLAPFTEQEYKHMAAVLQTSDRANPLNKSILDKIAVRSDINIAANLMGKAHISKLIEDIQFAIDYKKQVILKRYQSINSQTISDRVIEPISIDNNFRTITAYEIASKKNKTFVVERIKNVEVSHLKFKHEMHHLEVEKDVFGFTPNADFQEIPVHLELSLKAKILMEEEYPKTLPYIKKSKNKGKYIFKCTINDPRPLERFIKGLPDEVTILTIAAY
jgi:proteasome accessory factor C